METKANYVLVGLFTLIAVAAAFAFVYWTAAIGDRGETVMLRVRIPGSASGLSRGSAVLFNGVKVGDVQRVYIDVKDPTLAIADTQVDRLTPITRSTRADIGIAGLTGQANIELRGGVPAEPKLLDEAEETGEIPEITANPSAVTNLLQTAQDIFKRADSVLSNLEGFVTDVRGPLTSTVVNAEKFSQALGDNAAGVDDFLASVTRLSDQLAGASDRLEATLDAARSLITAVNTDQVREIVDNIDTLTGNISRSSRQFDGIVAGVDQAVRSFREFAEGARGTLARVDDVLEGFDPNVVRSAMANLNATLDSARGVFAALDQDRVRNIVANVDVLAANLGETSKRFEGIASRVDQAVRSIAGFADGAQVTVGRVDAILQGVDPEALGSAIANLDATLESARGVFAAVDQDRVRSILANVDVLAANLGRTSEQLDGVVDNVNSAVRAVASFSDGARDTLTRVGRVLDGIDPQDVRETIENIRIASQDVTKVVGDVSKVTTKVGERAGDIDKIIGDTSELAARLNQASVRVDGILVKVDTLLGSDDAEGLVVQARQTLQSFKQVADTLNSRLGTITDGLARFSTQGLRDVDALVRDSRRAINRIEEAVTDLGNNPQRILTGGEGVVRQYDGRARR